MVETNPRPVAWGACATFAVAWTFGLAGVGCGGSTASTSSSDAGVDATTDGAPGSSGGGLMGDGSLLPEVFVGGGGGSCLKFGAACATNGDCCGGDCQGSTCAYPACTSDGLGCTVNGECCSQSCTGGKCAALSATCSTLGNGCSSNAQCCSGLCFGGTCQASSFCGQPGDACSTGTDCCTGTCTVASGKTLGTCSLTPPGGPANCGMVDGVLCGGTGPDGGIVYVDSGLPQCGGGCCSRACAPFGPTGVLVCQPASGCHVVGDLCTKDGDCCGSAGLPGGSGMAVTCAFTPPSTVGVCRLPMGCKPDGDVCKLKTMSCNSSCDCCAGNCETMDTCKQDNVGVPRCAPAKCASAGGACASSASCCNGAPCVPNPVDGGAPRYLCSSTQCVAACGGCTNNADCCPGTSCVVAPGSAQGICGPCGGTPPMGDAGVGDASVGDASSAPDAGGGACALYGQICTTTADCCGGIPCMGGRCLETPP